jgi:hypothetical protein
MTQAIREAVIEPMLALYVPPSHLRHDGQAQEQALAAYQKALAGFDRDTLQRGWEKIVSHNTYWAWPTPAEIAQACRQCQPRPKPPSEEEQRKEKALGMAEAYTAHYMKTSYLARLARQEGWAGRLREYIADAAWVQGQLIAGVHSIGWNARLADGIGQFRSSAEASPPTARRSATSSSAARYASAYPDSACFTGETAPSPIATSRYPWLNFHKPFDRCHNRHYHCQEPRFHHRS